MRRRRSPRCGKTSCRNISRLSLQRKNNNPPEWRKRAAEPSQASGSGDRRSKRGPTCPAVILSCPRPQSLPLPHSPRLHPHKCDRLISPLRMPLRQSRNSRGRHKFRSSPRLGISQASDRGQRARGVGAPARGRCSPPQPRGGDRPGRDTPTVPDGGPRSASAESTHTETHGHDDHPNPREHRKAARSRRSPLTWRRSG